MLQNLLLTNLFLVANSLITIAFILYAFLYIDLYLKTKKTYALHIGLGGVLLALSFLSVLLFEIKGFSVIKEYLVLFIQFLGLLTIASGYGRELVPSLPGDKKIKVKSLAFPLFTTFLFFINFALAAFITAKNVYKVNYGRSKEFKPLTYFWWIMTFILFLNLIAFLSNDRFAAIEVAFSKYSVIWILVQLALLVAFCFMYKWVRLYLAFRNFTKILFDIWSFAIVLCVFLTSVFLTVNIPSYEREVTQVLKNNASLIQFNMEQIRLSNDDILNAIISNDDVLRAFEKEDSVFLGNQLRLFSTERNSLDRLVFVDSDLKIVYNSEDVGSVGEMLLEDNLLQTAVAKKEGFESYVIEKDDSIMRELTYQSALPVFYEDKFLGLVVGSKVVGYNFLKNVNAYTDQDILLLDSDNAILSMSLNTEKLFFDDTVRFQSVRNLDDDGSVFLVINNDSYLGSMVDIKSYFGENVASLVALSPYDIVSATVQNSMYLMSFYSLMFSFLAFVPSYVLAKKIEREAC